MENIKVALVHDWLTGQRGGEKVLEALAEVFPDAPIYTLFHFAGSQIENIEKKVVGTSFLQRMPFLKKHYRWYLPLFPLAAELFDLQRYDLVVSSSHCVAKGIIPHPDALHVSYIHSPVRYAWNQYHAYFSREKLSFFPNLLIPPIIHYLRQWDVTSSARVDHFIANSRCVARRVEKYYRRQADVVHPPVDTDFFRPPDVEPERRFDLIVSALVPYKMIDLAIAGYNRLGWPLKIVGDGPDFKKLRRLARPNVEFLGAQEGGDLRRLYQSARTLVLPGEEDFGIATLEAQACGTPVVAYGRGGSLETVVEDRTGVFFYELKPACLLAALDKFRGLEFNKTTLRAHAQGFSRDIFKEKIGTSIRQKWRAFKEAQ
ncbi:MAG: glycosyltransferase [Candidatus Aminicenantes bacterium]|nr:glycosyltransferase [Candidatus Aminicenantes bacterium]